MSDGGVLPQAQCIIPKSLGSAAPLDTSAMFGAAVDEADACGAAPIALTTKAIMTNAVKPGCRIDILINSSLLRE
ncbi:hypothetical protein ACQRWP_13075 [Micromonospora trifolii]|uniref:hypothetical protein n=1 Tax=Micromonospora trifolii TaxID=2911208 RepID=UPI003D2EBA07